MTPRGLTTAMGALIIGAMLQAGFVMAGDEHPVQSYAQRYNALKATTTAFLDSLHRNGADARVSKDNRELLRVRKDVMDFCFETQKEGHLLKVSSASKPGHVSDRVDLLVIAYACEAMEQVLEAEWDVLQNGNGNAGVLREIQAKYDELWKLADHRVTVTQYPLPISWCWASSRQLR